MPWGNRTGPMGYGPMSGRRAGYCAGYDAPGYANPVGGRGMGRGRGMGHGFGRGFGRGRGYFGYGEEPYYPSVPYNPGIAPRYQGSSPEEEKSYLENLVKGMEQELADIKARIKELANTKK